MAPSVIALHQDYSDDENYLVENYNAPEECLKSIGAEAAASFGRANQVPLAKELIGKALKERVQNVNGDVCEAGEEEAFFVADLGEVYRQHIRWKMNLARVTPHYGKHHQI
jgi:ornithine decarboxylase